MDVALSMLCSVNWSITLILKLSPYERRLGRLAQGHKDEDYLLAPDEGSREGTPGEDSGAIDTIRSYILVDDAQVSDWSNGSIRASG